jgi:phosphatidate cytidylyltransferase
VSAWVYALAALGAFVGLFVALHAATFWIAAVFWVVAVPLWLRAGMKPGHRAALIVSGLVVIVPAAVALALLPPAEVLAVLVLVWIADSAAYFVGRAWGRRKLAPSISPGKSWEGALGGVVAAVAYAIICGTFLWGNAWPAYLVAAVVLAAISIVGDLFESAAKRQAGVKDSGTLLPGHGGILDRIDSATAVLPIAALLLSLR